MEFSRQEHWSGLLCPPPEDLPDPGWSSKFCCSSKFPGDASTCYPHIKMGSKNSGLLWASRDFKPHLLPLVSAFVCPVPSPFPSFLFLPFWRPFPIKQFYSSIKSQHKESLDSEDFLNNPQPPGRWKRFLLLLPHDSANLHCVRALITLFVCRCFPLQEKYIRNRTSCITVNLAPKQYLVNNRRTMARQWMNEHLTTSSTRLEQVV